MTSIERVENQDRSHKSKAYLILSNIGKRSNYGTLLRSAAAFGIHHVYIVGERKLKTFGNQGTVPHISMTFCTSFNEVRHLLGPHTKVCGIEITQNARSIASHPFSGDTAFMLGNEGVGMSEKQLQFCNEFVYIPQYSCATASLNVAVAGSIVFHHFALWASLSEAPRTGSKFNVTRPVSKLDKYLNASPEERKQYASLRAQRQHKHDVEEEWNHEIFNSS